MKVLSLAFTAAALSLATADHHETDLIDSLPGLGFDPGFKQYAGHLELDTHEKMFYWYAESQSAPSEDPIVLWLNGGPGCSSLGGFFTENGPFVVRPDMTLEPNRYAWNRKTNLVWLESPAGVGFSDELQEEEYYNDDVVADRTYNFLQKFFEAYPELQHRDFYVTGESYVGIYGPYLVSLLAESPIPNVNFKGFAIGNPFTDQPIDGLAYFDYYVSHALMSMEGYHKMKTKCGEAVGYCLRGDVDSCPKKCDEAITTVIKAAAVDDLNPYYLYGDVCLLTNEQAKSLHNRVSYPQSADERVQIGPCADQFTEVYLNQKEVQEALHVHHSREWTACNDDVVMRYSRAFSALPKYHTILNQGYKALIYSGDADSIVNFLGTERWIGEDGLKLKVVDEWKPWYGPDHQVAGYVQEYEGLTFKTVKGAGHMVPAVRPLHGLNMFECFVFGEEECSTFEYPEDMDEVRTGDVATLPRSSNTVEVHFLWFYVLLTVVAVDAVVVVGYVSYKLMQRRRSGYQSIEQSQ